MESSKSKLDPYCVQFKDDIINQIKALTETGLTSTEKLKLIGNLTRLEHCKDCSLTQLKAERSETQSVTMSTSPALAESKSVHLHLNEAFCSEPSKSVGTWSKATPIKDVKAGLTCPICGKCNFGPRNPKSGLKRHLKSVHKDELPTPPEIKCPNCDKFCKSQSGLRRHQDQKHKDNKLKIIIKDVF